MKHIAASVTVALVWSTSSLAQTADVSARPSKAGDQCLARLEGTAALDSKGRVRFELRPAADKGDSVVLAVEPDRFNKEFYLCRSTVEPNGALRANIIVKLEGGPEYKGLHRDVPFRGTDFDAVFVGGSFRPLTFMKDLSLKSGSWQPMGEQFGLRRYLRVSGVKDGKLTHDAMYTGAEYVGTSPGGFFVKISCVDFDLKFVAICHLSEELTDYVRVSIGVPPSNLDQWREYSRIAEQYFAEHIER